MMKIAPYLVFDGNCGEAFRFYHELLGGELDLMTFGDSPMADATPAEQRDRVMHVALTAGGQLLMGSDSPPGRFDRPQGIHVSLMVDGPEEAERVFKALEKGGTVTMPLEKTFWAERFGMVTDRFGIPWMVNSDES